MLDRSIGSDISPIKIGLRPESITISPDGTFSGIVKSCEYFGHQYIVGLEFNGEKLRVSGITEPLGIGSTVNFKFDEKDLLFFDAQTGHNLEQNV